MSSRITSKNRERATRSDIFDRLQRLIGQEAESVIQQVIRKLDSGETDAALTLLIVFDARLGGVGLHDIAGEKLPGIYRPYTYVWYSLQHPEPRHFSRDIVFSACGTVEFLLVKMALWGIFRLSPFDKKPMGAMVALVRPFVPKQLGDDLQWLSSRIYNFAKHDYDVSTRTTREAKEHYFDLDEALAIYFIARRLEVDLEKISGKSPAELMQA